AILDRDPRTGVVVHAHRVLDAVEAIAHVITRGFLDRVVDRGATRLGGFVRVVLLHPFLDLAALVATGRGARDGRNGITRATTDLVADHAADHAADHGTGDPLRIAGRRLVRDDFVTADLSRNLDRLGHGLHGQDVGRVALLDRLVAGESARRG